MRCSSLSLFRIIFLLGSETKFSKTPRLFFRFTLSAQRTPVVMNRSRQEFSLQILWKAFHKFLYRKKVLMERNRENSCFYRTFPLFSFHNTFITSVQDLSAKTKGHRFFAMMLFHLLKFLCLLFQKLPVSFLHRLWHKPLLW